MEAKDTVMSDRKLLKFELKYSRSDTFYWGAAFDAAINAQAEISFKAGAREVIEEIEEHSAWDSNDGWLDFMGDWDALKQKYEKEKG